VPGDQVLLGDGARSSLVGEKLEHVNPAEIGDFYETGDAAACDG
jgi:hypothetical protein